MSLNTENTTNKGGVNLVPNLDIKKEGLKVLGGIIFIIILIFIIRYFKLGLIGRIIFLCSINLVFMLIQWFRGFGFSVIKYLKNVLFIVCFIIVLFYVNKLGSTGYILSIIIIVASILFKKRKKYFQIKHHIESMIWGEPLKNFTERKEKPPKLKIKF